MLRLSVDMCLKHVALGRHDFPYIEACAASSIQPPDLLLLHGLGGSMWQWVDVMRNRPADRCWMAVDLPGHGDNPLPAGCSLQMVVSWLREFIESATKASSIGLAGHSLAGLIVLQFAATNPERVSWLGLLATATRFSIHPDLREQLLRGRIRDDFLIRACGTPMPARSLRRIVDDFRRARFGAQAGDVWGTHAVDLRHAVASIDRPALVIAAGSDRVISPRKSRELHGLLPAAELVVLEGRGHYLHLEAPARIAAELTRFTVRPHEY